MTALAVERRPLRIALDVRVKDGTWGGIQQVVEGLVSGLSALGGNDEFLLLGDESVSGWLGARVGGGCRLIHVPARMGKSTRRRTFDWMEVNSPRLAGIVSQVAQAAGPLAVPLPTSDGFVESLGVDLLHFVTPQGFFTKLRTIYQPHDLLHIHLPETLSPLRRVYRERAYAAFSRRATIVATMTDWGRTDLCNHLGLDRRQVAVIPWAPVTGAQPMSQGAPPPAFRPALPDRFLLYPAQTWPHKNHERLLQAIALLRDSGMRVHLVCTGHLNDHARTIDRQVRDLKLEDQVRFLGYVTADELGSLYRQALALVFPSRFEGWGLPLVEAFAVGLPVASSNATVLPEVAASAALLFDPLDAREIARAIGRIWTDEPLRRSLRDRGHVRASTLSWDRTARMFRALYRRVAGRALSAEDRQLLAPPTLIE